MFVSGFYHKIGEKAPILYREPAEKVTTTVTNITLTTLNC
jgi:hypothetical protein